jgi:CDP-glycerol glycerophosphotransferase (TagB/SpsB family)
LLNNLALVKNFNVVIRLHPRMKIEDFMFVEDYGIKVAAWDTADLIPLCDIYVASVSATIRWAITCGKPVINYDVYRYRYQDFTQVKGVITIEEKYDFIKVLSRLTNDMDYYNEIATAQRQEAKYWSNLDGKSEERLLRLIDLHTN